MQHPLQITFRGFPPSEAVEARIREKTAKLEHFCDRIIGCRVSVDAPHRHHHKGRLYTVRVDLVIPGAELVARQDHGQNHAYEDVYVAIRDAFQAITRQLEEHLRRQRGHVKQHEAPLMGRVTRLFSDDGYGFIETPDGLEIYFHENSVIGSGFGKLTQGRAVRYVMAETESTQGPQATTVELIASE